MAELIPPLIDRKNTRVIGHISDYTPEQLQELFSKNKERPSGSVTGNNSATKEDGPHPSAAGAFGWGSLHGFTMGYDDELAGILAAGPIAYWSGDEEAVKKYKEVTKRWRDYQRAADKEHPYASIAGNIMGGAGAIGTTALIPTAGLTAGAARVAAAMRSALGADVILGSRAGAMGAQVTSKALAAGERAIQSALAGGANRAAARAAGEAAMKATAKKEAAKFSRRRAVKYGVGYGAIAGSGEGEGLEDSIGSAILGAGFGLATPFVASEVSKVTPFVTSFLKGTGKVSKKALRKFINPAEKAAFSIQKPEKEVFKISKKALKKVSHTLGDESVDNLDMLLKQRGSDAMIIDLHDGLSARAFESAKKDPDTYSIVSNRLGARQDASVARVKDELTEAMGPKVDTLDLKKEIIKKAQEKAGPFYKKAKAAPISNAVSEDLSLLQETPAFQKAYTKAIARMPNEVDATVIGSNGYPKLNMRILHKMKEVLDDQINSARIKGKWGYARDLTDFKQRILDVLDTSSPDYAKARKIYRGELEIGDALDRGKEAMQKSVDLDTIKNQLSDIGSMERDAFKKGVRAQIEHAAGNARNPEHNLSSLFDTENGYQKLRMIFGDDKAKQLINVLRPEVERSKLFARLPRHIGEVEANAANKADNIKKSSLMKLATKIFTTPWGRMIRASHREVERDIAALVTARDQGNFGLARQKAVELIKTFHEAEKKRLITRENHTKLINFLGVLLNGSADRMVIN
ncbi:hypothetical protein V3564_04895 [Bartonella sp. B12(2025)]